MRSGVSTGSRIRLGPQSRLVSPGSKGGLNLNIAWSALSLSSLAWNGGGVLAVLQSLLPRSGRGQGGGPTLATLDTMVRMLPPKLIRKLVC